MTKIRCVVERITYQNPENGYSVLKCRVKDYSDLVPVLMNHYIMLQRNLIYTGITRAKKVLVMIGTKKALAYAVKNVTVTKRNTMLKERLITCGVFTAKN